MNKDNNIQDKIDKSIPIADIPAILALEANKQWKTIRHVRLVERLTEFRVQVEAEAETTIANIPTTLALALADVTEALGIKNPEDLLQVLGAGTYLAVYVDPIPYQPVPGHQPVHGPEAYPTIPPPPHHTINLLIARLRDTLRGRRRGKVKAEPA